MLLLFFCYQYRCISYAEYLLDTVKTCLEHHFLLIVNSAGRIDMIKGAVIRHSGFSAQARGLGEQKFLLCLRFDHIIALNIASAGFYSVIDSTIQLDFGLRSKVMHGFKRNCAIELIGAKFGFEVVAADELHILFWMLQA